MAAVATALTIGSAARSTSPASTNIVDVYFYRPELFEGETFLGGFFTDSGTSSFDLDGAISTATCHYFVYGDGGGTNSYNGKSCYTLAEYNTGSSSAWTVQQQVATVPSANFSGGTVLNGQSSQFVIVVPEPGALALAAVGVAAVAASVVRRGRASQSRRGA